MNRATSGSGSPDVTATSCLIHRGENGRTAPGKPSLTALTGHTAIPRPAAASCGAAVVTDVLITGSRRTPARAKDWSSQGLDHLVSVATERSNGPVASLERRALLAAFDAKVVGPILLAKHFAQLIAEKGSLLSFSGLAAWRPSPGLVAMAATNGSVNTLASALAVELAPTRVNAISPGVIDTSNWDTAVPDKREWFRQIAASAPVGRVGDPSDVSAAARALLVNPYITGETLHVDGGARWS
ncbi:hypothetical protein ADL28_00480 [Streptomyces violaceusniger]|uniref:Short-chain dehydrogenase n=1 Tax=Streptomyces violaceusniger TaxID=68280 RepID=A0A0X3XDT0_STRVO|nr:hypothetical protein ADL28_00480 [Streptomyces violaceusniger]